jgi:signal transduction histidine kinase
MSQPGPHPSRGNVPLRLPFEVGDRGHVVQFYESDDYLAELVARFFALGLAGDEPAIAFATQDHCRAIRERLAANGVDVEEKVARGLLQFRDASETLATFMVGDLPDAERLTRAVGTALDQVTDRGARRRARVFGEMVDVLWRAGNREGALRLEELWNELGAARPFALLCAYAMGNFYREAHSPEFRGVCHRHTKVLPTEHFLRIGDHDSALREITRLQQRAAALEHEIERCHALEAALREAAAAARASEAERAQLLDRERAARADAEAASRAKDEFLAMLGHELRNPLSPIVTALELRRLRGEPTSSPEWLIIERQVRHLVRMVDDLLDVHRITRGKIVLAKERVEIAVAVAEAVSMARSLVEERRHELDVDVPPAGLAVHGDPTRLAQVVTNLLVNAAKYTEPSGRIRVTARVEGGDVVLRVRDTGIGIAPEMAARIFDVFVQERQAVDRAHGGLGLGLAIVRNLVALHGGSVAVESAGRGQGSEFVVRLPRAADVAVAAGAAAGRPCAGARAARRILVVDDNRDSAETFAELLRTLGHEPVVAHDAPAALRVAAQFVPEVVFLDIGLPETDGYELATALRAQPALATVRIVAVTGYGQETDRRRSAAAGFDRHLVKPIDLGTVDALVQ